MKSRKITPAKNLHSERKDSRCIHTCAKTAGAYTDTHTDTYTHTHTHTHTYMTKRTAADLPLLLPCEDQVEPPLLHNKSSLRGASHTTALTRALLLPANRGVAAVAKDAATTKYLPLRACQGRILFEAGSAKFCPSGNSIIRATRPTTFLTGLGFCFDHGCDKQA